MDQATKDTLYSYTSRIISNASKAKAKPKGLITNDTQYRLQVANIYEMFGKADKLALELKFAKLKKVEKQIVALSLEILDYERFRMKNP